VSDLIKKVGNKCRNYLVYKHIYINKNFFLWLKYFQIWFLTIQSINDSFYYNNIIGGEKTLSSLALVFSLHYFKPNPLYFMDEIDAALDFKNVQIVAKFIKERTKNA